MNDFVCFYGRRQKTGSGESEDVVKSDESSDSNTESTSFSNSSDE